MFLCFFFFFLRLTSSEILAQEVYHTCDTCFLVYRYTHYSVLSYNCDVLEEILLFMVLT